MMNDQQQSLLATGTPFGADIVSWGDFVEGFTMYEEDAIRPPPTNTKLALWKDMADEPGKYGDDIDSWLALDAELSESPGYWRMGAYWVAKQQQLDWERLRAMLWNAWDAYLMRKEKMVIRIQAAVRGHLARHRLPWRDCCMCLAHHISPIRTDVGFMCNMCFSDGPMTDLIGMDDPWDWFRGEK